MIRELASVVPSFPHGLETRARVALWWVIYTGLAALVGTIIGRLLAARDRRITAKIEALPFPDGWFRLPCNGTEMFTTFILEASRVYCVEFAWNYWYTVRRGETEWTRHADALYHTDGHGNFVERYDGLLLDGKPLKEWIHEVELEDRLEHRYAVRIDGTQNRLSLAVRPPDGRRAGELAARVRILPEGTPSPTGRLTESHALARLGEVNAVLQGKVRAALLTSEPLRNWGDLGFIQAHAQLNYKDLLAERHGIIRGYLGLFEHADVAEYLRKNHPEAFVRFTGKFEALLQAERVDLEVRRSRAAIKPRLTPEQVRALIVRREEIVSEDDRAILETSIAAWERNSEMLAAKGLEEDEITAAIGTLSDAIEDARGRLAERKGGSNALTKLA